MARAGRGMLVISAIVFTAVLALFVALLVNSHGTPEPFVGEDGQILPGSLSEKTFIEVNGTRQGMFIKSLNAKNPVLLYLHGGMPDYFLTSRYPTGLEELFTVVWWEQRGSGISFSPNIPRETLTLRHMIADALAVTDYLRRRFAVEKIYLMGHSGGTFIGIQAVATHPERYHAYIGISQMTDQLESERLAWRYMRDEYRRLGDRAMVARLEAAPVSESGGLPPAYLALRDDAMHPLGVGTTRDMRWYKSGLLLRSLLFREYTLGEKLNLWRAKASSGVSALLADMLATDLAKTTLDFSLPIYFVHGKHDMTCSYVLAKAYLGKLQAPLKGFYTFAESAHSPLFEEPAKLRRILAEDVLQRRSGQADSECAEVCNLLAEEC
ncbi:MAG: alpha/beta hydrolase [Myxococcota bacterium]|nr:alpha/beta hydrolase [Myxococcota bacterium]